MAKEVKVDLKQDAMDKMQTMVEQHNELIKELEVKQMIVEHQGYIKGLEACEESCKPGDK